MTQDSFIKSSALEFLGTFKENKMMFTTIALGMSLFTNGMQNQKISKLNHDVDLLRHPTHEKFTMSAAQLKAASTYRAVPDEFRRHLSGKPF